MARIGRNDPCPCRSTQKYKKCCLQLHERAARERARLLAEPTTPEATNADLARLERLSREVLGLIRSGRLDEAEQQAHELSTSFPDQIDGVERLAQVYEAQGQLAKAAAQYRRAAGFTIVSEDFDPEVTAMLLAKAEALELRLGAAHPSRS